MVRGMKANANGTTVKRAEDFEYTHNYVVTLRNEKQFLVYRDTDQFSFPIWYCVDHDEIREFTKAEIIARLERDFGAAAA